MNVWDYVRDFGSVVDDPILEEVAGANPSRRDPVGFETFCGLPLSVKEGVPAEACLPEPEKGYHPPSCGAAADVTRFLTVGLEAGMNTFLYGPPGSGKDAFVHAYSARTRTPALKCQIVSGTDTHAWLWSRSLKGGDTHWEEGELLKLVRDGYLSSTGERIPGLVLLSDFDRADDDQIETFRLMLDTIGSGRIPLPQGGSVPVFPGTMFVATANTVGSGDTTGRYVSANVIDASILNRFPVVREMPYMAWEDEQIPLINQFPKIAEVAGFLPGIKTSEGWTGLGAVVKILRSMIAEGKAYGEFTFRDLSNWLGFSEKLIPLYVDSENPSQKAIAEAFRLILDRFDPETRHSIMFAVQGNIPGLKLEGPLK